MLSLPHFHRYSYEPLISTSPTLSAPASKVGIMSKMKQRRLQLLFILLGLLGCVQLVRLCVGPDGFPLSTYGLLHQNNTTASMDAITSKTQLKDGLKDKGTQRNSESQIKPKQQSIPSNPKIVIPILAPAPTAIISSHNKTATEELFNIPEEDWHIPLDADRRAITLLRHTRFKPFFHQEKDNVHQEKGFGTDIRLTEAHFIRRSLYRHLLESLHTFAGQHDFHFWLAHGTLMGQKWGQKIMTGDTDVDLQTTLGSLHRVKKYENQLWEDRFELLVNPHYLLRKTQNVNGLGRDKNVIDARWIDTMTGYYIDITALSSEQANDYNNDMSPFTGDKSTFIVQDKSPHTYSLDAISPTRRCRFEGMDLWCPNQIDTVLDEEYKTHQLPHFHTWRFNSTIQTFTEIDCPALIEMYRFPTRENCDEECQYVISKERRILYRALVITGPPMKKGCMIKVTIKGDLGKEEVREYWGREVVGQTIDHQNMRNHVFPPMTLS